MNYKLVVFAFGPAVPYNDAGYTVAPLTLSCEKQSDCYKAAEELANALRPGYALPCQIWAMVGGVPVRMREQFIVRSAGK